MDNMSHNMSVLLAKHDIESMPDFEGKEAMLATCDLFLNDIDDRCAMYVEMSQKDSER